MKHIFRKNFPFLICLLLSGLVLQLLIALYIESKDAYREIDETLFKGANNIKYYLKHNFISKDLNSSSLTIEEIYKDSSFLHERAMENNIDYFYLLVKDGDDIVYAIMSDEKEELDKLHMAGYWFSLQDAGDDSFDETWEAFDSDKPIYIESKDMWGEYRSIYIPQMSHDGRKYIAGADITTTSLKKLILVKSLKSVLPLFFFLIIIIPAIVIIKKSFLEKRKMEDYIEIMDKRDKLTNAYSRNYGLHLLSKSFNEYHTSGKNFSICLIDIDNLKFINETMGMEAGDTLLIVVERIVSRVFRKTDCLIRLEGNKLMVILPQFNRKYTKEVFKALEEKIEFFNLLNKKSLFIRLNYTMSEYTSGSMMDFIEKTRENLKIESSDKEWKNKNLQDDILRGIRNNEFQTYFQPKVYMKEKRVAFEALVRWLHPEKGLIPPNMFIPIAEKSFLINEITKIVLEDSLVLAEKLETNISVNLSLVSFENSRFLHEIKERLITSEYSKYITFELTEGLAIKDIDATLIKMNKLKTAGISFSIDDFGSGYSSLPFIEKLPINEIKIDRSFIRNVNNSKVNQLVIEFVNKIANFKGFSVICEGTEDSLQIKKLMFLGNFSFQGYYFGRPEPSDEVILKYNNGFYLDKLREFV